MACDVRLASSTARFRTGDAYIGVVPSWGMSLVRLVHYIGRNRALDMLMLGEDMNAEQAREVGLVSRVIPADKLIEEALAIATQIASMSQSVAMQIKDAVNRAFETTLTEGVNYERRLFQAAFGTPAQREGMHAFLEKRLPNFEGL